MPLPKYESLGAAALDLRANLNERVHIAPGGTFKCSTGFALGLSAGIHAMIVPRSGKGSKGLVLANGVGIIDSDYRGEIIISLLNRNKSGPITIKPGDRVAQMLFAPVFNVDLYEVEDFDHITGRGDGGFGSTGDT